MLRTPPRRKPDFSLATINIVFLLLLFFLVAGSVVQRSETGVLIPVAERLPLENLPRPLLMLGHGDQILLDGQAIDRGSLLERARAATQRPGTFLNILAERDLPAMPLIEIIDLLSNGAVPARIVTINQDGRGEGAL